MYHQVRPTDGPTDQRTNRLRTSPLTDLEEQATNLLTTQRGDGQTDGRTSAFMEMRGHLLKTVPN